MEINGKQVVDSTKPLLIEVIPEDCKKGKTKDAAACAAAVAIMREHPEVLGARVHRSVTYIEYLKKWVRYLTPTSLRTELTVFDRGAKFEPGPFCLTAPSDKAQSLKALKKRKQQYDARSRHDQNGTKRIRHEIPNIRPRGANR